MLSVHDFLSSFSPAFLAENTVLFEKTLASLTTFHIGGVADAVISPPSVSSLCTLVCAAKAQGIPYRILGAGSNILAPDEGFQGLVFLTKKLNKISINGNYVLAECGLPLNSLILHTMRHGLGGMSSLYGIPASVGGAVYMNAGAHGDEISRHLVKAEVLDAESGVRFYLANDELSFAYRTSVLQSQKNLVLLRAYFCLPSVLCEETRREICEVCRRRRDSQPLEFPSAGSAFRRPEGGVEAWRLIDAAGLRGMRIGGAEISKKHAGFIVNCGGATASDVRALLDICQERVGALFGVRLVREIEFL